jgi:hypothetical protein
MGSAVSIAAVPLFVLKMSLSDQHISDLARTTPYSFADWPNPSVPAFGAGVYAIWHITT